MVVGLLMSGAIFSVVLLTPASAARPQLPRLLKMYVSKDRGIDTLHINFSKTKLLSCADIPVRGSWVDITFKAQGLGYNGIGAQWCRDFDVRKGKVWWNDQSRLFDASDDGGGKVRLTVSDEGKPMKKELGYWVVIGGKLARSGRIAISLTKYGRTIWQEEDDFVNVCINRNVQIWKSGGRLYCTVVYANGTIKILR